jgi:alpha-beta hydrolase superfamily lysophospholipase
MTLPNPDKPEPRERRTNIAANRSLAVAARSDFAKFRALQDALEGLQIFVQYRLPGIFCQCMSWNHIGIVFCVAIQFWIRAGNCATLPQIPAPGGSFGIGRVGYDWVDTRPDRYSSAPNAHRELMVYFWYPVSTGSANTKGQYLPGAQRMDELPEVQSVMRQEFKDRWQAIVSGAIFSHAQENAPVATSTRPFPVVIFSHGLGSTGFNYTCLIEDLVSRGYVVVSIEHTYVALAVWFPDGRVVLRHNEPPPSGLTREERFQWMVTHTGELISEGAADVRFVLNRMTAESLLAGRIDLKRVAAMGHSAGAEFAARACQLDARFRACVDLDGGMVPVAALPEYPDHATLKQPLLFLEAYHAESQMAGTPAEQAAYFKKKEEQLQRSRPGSYDVILRSPGIAHPSFSDIPLLFAGQDGFPARELVLHNLDLIRSYVREFLDRNLKGDKAPLLDGGDTGEVSVQPLGR